MARIRHRKFGPDGFRHRALVVCAHVLGFNSDQTKNNLVKLGWKLEIDAIMGFWSDRELKVEGV
jgi:hypothetical protein